MPIPDSCTRDLGDCRQRATSTPSTWSGSGVSGGVKMFRNAGMADRGLPRQTLFALASA